MGQPARKTAAIPPQWAIFGLNEAVIESFRQAARERAPGLAAAYGRRWRRVSGRVGRAPWPAPWPEDNQARISWKRAGSLALAALARLDRPLARRAAALWHRGRARPMAGLAPGIWRVQHRPLGASVRMGFDASLASALALAPALWLAGQITSGWFGPSNPPPARAAIEAGGGMARLAALDQLAISQPLSAQHLLADTALTYLVRLPALDAAQRLCQGGRERALAWQEAASAYAPALAWAEALPASWPCPADPPIVQAIGYACATHAHAGQAQKREAQKREVQGQSSLEGYASWSALGPAATLSNFALVSGLALESASSWRGVYDLAEQALAQMERA